MRNANHVKIQIAKKELDLDDDAYRDALQRATGKRSSKGMSHAQHLKVLTELRRLGWKPNFVKRRAGSANSVKSLHGKSRALWISLYHLGVVRNSTDQALDAFVKRQTRIEALRFLDIRNTNRVIEALKDMGMREAGVIWNPQTSPRVSVMEAQWRVLAGLNAVRNPSSFAIQFYVEKVTKSNTLYTGLTAAQADRVIAALGDKIRTARQPS